MTALEHVIGKQLTAKRKLQAAKSRFVIARMLRKKNMKKNMKKKKNMKRTTMVEDGNPASSSGQ